ncbi:mu-type opioid receptor-like [Oculina patagonica]
MNSSFDNSSQEAISPSPLPSQSAHSITPLSRATYSIVCIVAFLGNMLVILVFVWDKKLLKKSYNMLILSLAIADVLTSVTLITNPAFVLGDLYPYPNSRFLGELFCRFIWSRAFLFQLVTFSVYICLVLTAERWFAVVKPHKYSDAFSRKNVVRYIISSCVCSFIVTAAGMFETVYNTSSRSQICEIQFIGKGSVARVLLGIVQSSMKMLIPCLLMIGLYIHMVVTVNTSAVASAASKAKLRGGMTRMVGVACFTLIICYAPNQILMVFAMAGKTKLDTPTHHATALLTFMASCVNPLIYGLSNRNYRKRYREILFAMCPKVIGGCARDEPQPVATNRNQRRVHPLSPHETEDNPVINHEQS